MTVEATTNSDCWPHERVGRPLNTQSSGVLLKSSIGAKLSGLPTEKKCLMNHR